MSEKIKGLYAVIDNTFTPNLSHYELANMVLLGGCKIVQLRMKMPAGSLKDGEPTPLWRDDVYAVAKDIMTLKERFDFTFIVNDYVDVAGEVKADGVHVGSNDIAPAEIRKRLGSNILIGYSSHSVEEGIAASKGEADYVALGAIFPSRTKGPLHPVQGLDKLSELCKRSQKPVVAIGGIDRTNIDSVIAAKASSVAMITALTCAKNVAEETSWYVSRFK